MGNPTATCEPNDDEPARPPRGCRCPQVFVGGRPTGSFNWNPDCPVHPWNEKLQAQSDRAVRMQRRARAVRLSRKLADAASECDDWDPDINPPFSDWSDLMDQAADLLRLLAKEKD